MFIFNNLFFFQISLIIIYLNFMVYLGVFSSEFVFGFFSLVFFFFVLKLLKSLKQDFVESFRMRFFLNFNLLFIFCEMSLFNLIHYLDNLNFWFYLSNIKVGLSFDRVLVLKFIKVFFFNLILKKKNLLLLSL